MRILHIHNRYIQRGGEDQCVDTRVRMLREWGHTVDVVLEDNSRVAALGGAHLALRTIWSGASYRSVRRKLAAGSYDVVDIHNTLPLFSPSVYYAAHVEGVAVVQTLHNYRLLCPSATLFRSGRVCEDCLGRRVAWPGVVHACYRHSRPATAAVAAMLAIHGAMRTWSREVDIFITLTEFARQKFISGGLTADRIVVVPNVVHPDPGPGKHDGGFALFVGRLTPEKGVDTLLRAWSDIGADLPLRVIGSGPLASQFGPAARAVPGVEWLGEQPPQRVSDVMGASRLLVVPSEWYETFGVVCIEAFARGTPVVASRIGALSEVVDDGRTGLLFEPSNARSLSDAIRWLIARPSELERMGIAARRTYETAYTAEHAIAGLVDAYQRAIRSRKSTHGVTFTGPKSTG